MECLYNHEGLQQEEIDWHRYLQLVRHEALRLQVRLPASVDLDDLLQAGAIGLMNAISRFDAQHGTAFTTYAAQRIRGAMLDELRERDWAPRRVRRDARNVAAAIAQIEQHTGRNATEAEIIAALNITQAEYRAILMETNNSKLFSLETLYEDHNDATDQLFASQGEQNPLDTLIDQDLRQQIMNAITQLPEREQQVLSLYYQDELNLKEIGAVLGVGESRVSQIHSQAIKRLSSRLRE
ncbi:RNA polymerase sigma factor FliA [Rosenbergiella australiborealis]|uniref:RNA polymerase sigma factor n=1 Tax=Rosenbergiella australiborealis TaxID=1544696 RepID=A0ABS5T7B9_9GAMM|nr:RNA polymerase sigma factor FliA [Rosenbergiella australiborealis]MBT0728227.1 RNA polymerase sigma factor FliA [Rosenbergiella australiborealis]